MGNVDEDDADLEISEPLGPPTEIGSDDMAMLLLSVPERVADLLIGLTADQLGYRHGPAFPTADEVARHLAETGGHLDVEITGAALGSPAAESAAPKDLALPDLLQDWQRRRRRAADLLRGVDDARWEEALRDLCETGLRHELGHLSQLRNLTALVPAA